MRFLSVTSGQGTTSVTRCATTTPADGTEETAHSTLMILGKIALRLCSAGGTSMMGSVMVNATAQGVFMTALTAKDRKDNATLCMTSTVKTTMQMVTVIRVATMQNVNGTVWTVPTTCRKNSPMVTWFWWSTFPRNSLKIALQPSSENSAVFFTLMWSSVVMPKENR